MLARELHPLVLLIVVGVALSPISGSVIRNGVKINALPLPVSPYRNGIVKVVAKIEKKSTANDTDEVELQNITVRTPAVSVNYWNASQYPTNIEIEPTNLQNLLALPVFSDLLDDVVVSALESQQSSNDDILDPTLLSSVDKLKKFADGLSSADTLQKAYGTTFLESLMDRIKNKSKLLYDIENSIEPSSKIAKREAIWSEAGDATMSALPPGNQSPKSGPMLMLVHRPTHTRSGRIIHEIPRYWEFVYGNQRQRRSAAKEVRGLGLLHPAYFRRRHHLLMPSRRMVAARPLYVRRAISPYRRQRRISHQPLIHRLVTFLISPQTARMLLNTINATLRPLIPVPPPIPGRTYLRNTTPVWSNIVPTMPHGGSYSAAAGDETPAFSPIEALYGNKCYPQTADLNLPYRNYLPSIESVVRPVGSAAIPFTGVSFEDANVDRTLKNFHDEAQWREYWRSKTINPFVGALSNVFQHFLLT